MLADVGRCGCRFHACVWPGVPIDKAYLLLLFGARLRVETTHVVRLLTCSDLTISGRHCSFNTIDVDLTAVVTNCDGKLLSFIALQFTSMPAAEAALSPDKPTRALSLNER
jgi:hypothetical protein